MDNRIVMLRGQVGYISLLDGTMAQIKYTYTVVSWLLNTKWGSHECKEKFAVYMHETA
jgi:hypothetical protein